MVVIVAGTLAEAQVELRGQREPLDAEVVGVGMEGVRVRMPDQQEPRVIAWHQVRRVRGEWATTAARFEEYAEKSWRATARLTRGDTVGAEPLFEELFTVYEDRAGATAAVVAEGLLACRLRRGARVAAIRPWLVLVRSGRPGMVLDEPLLDPELGLVPTLPPIWVETAALERSRILPAPLPDEQEVGGHENAGSSGGRSGISEHAKRARALGAWYHYAARRRAGVDADEPGVSGSDPSVSLVASMVRATDGDAAIRRSARAELRRIMASRTGSWVEAWCRAAIGRSLVAEPDGQARMRGVVSLLHVPARFGSAQRYLAGLCLAEAALALDDHGDTEAARRVLSELERRYPRHPALGLSGLEPLRRSMQSPARIGERDGPRADRHPRPARAGRRADVTTEREAA